MLHDSGHITHSIVQILPLCLLGRFVSCSQVEKEKPTYDDISFSRYSCNKQKIFTVCCSPFPLQLKSPSLYPHLPIISEWIEEKRNELRQGVECYYV